MHRDILFLYSFKNDEFHFLSYKLGRHKNKPYYKMMIIKNQIINHAACLALIYNFSASYASAETKLTLLEKVYSNGNNDVEGYLAVSYENSNGTVVNVPIKRGKRRTSYKNDDLICQRLGYEAAASSWFTPTYSQFVPKGDVCGAQYLNMINGDLVTMDDDAFEDCLGSVRKNGQSKYASKYIKCVNIGHEGLYLKEMTPLGSDTLLSDSVELFENWELSFDIQVNSILSDWSSIVHLTNGIQNTNDGNNRRMPGIWFYGGSYKLFISSTQSCDPVGEMGSYYVIDYDTNWQDQEPGTVNNVRILHYAASAEGPSYTGLWINGVAVEETSDWTNSCDTGTVNLWAANPWFPAADASIGNLVYKEVSRQDNN